MDCYELLLEPPEHLQNLCTVKLTFYQNPIYLALRGVQTRELFIITYYISASCCVDSSLLVLHFRL
jgi:hypothetical protein